MPKAKKRKESILDILMKQYAQILLSNGRLIQALTTEQLPS